MQYNSFFLILYITPKDTTINVTIFFLLSFSRVIKTMSADNDGFSSQIISLLYDDIDKEKTRKILKFEF